RRTVGLAGVLPRLVGYDAEPDAVRAALACIEAAGLRGIVHVERRTLADVTAPERVGTGLVVCNPPWGERLGSAREGAGSGRRGSAETGSRRALESLYAAFGRLLRERFAGWDAALLVGEPSLGRSLGLRARK